MVNQNELACSYSALILTDSGVEISAENIKKLLKAANVTVDALWPTLFTKAIKNINVRELLDSASSASPVAATPITATAVPTQAAAPDTGKAAKEEKKEESEEEDDDMGFGLFD